MMHFLKGGNWQDGPMSFDVDTISGIENMIVYGEYDSLRRMQDLEGLSDRQIAIVEMRVGWGRTRIMRFLLEEPKADCVKEGLWVW